jgi:hypothetical protein
MQDVKAQIKRELIRMAALEDQARAKMEEQYERLIRIAEEGPAADGSDTALLRELCFYMVGSLDHEHAQNQFEILELE